MELLAIVAGARYVWQTTTHRTAQRR